MVIEEKKENFEKTKERIKSLSDLLGSKLVHQCFAIPFLALDFARFEHVHELTFDGEEVGMLMGDALESDGHVG